MSLRDGGRIGEATGFEQDSGRWRGLNHVIDEQSLFTHGVDVTVERSVSELELNPRRDLVNRYVVT